MYIEYLYDTYKYEQLPYGRKLVTAYLITNCTDDAWFYTSKTKAINKIKEFPDYAVYEWQNMVYDYGFSELQIEWRRPLKKNNEHYTFDDTVTPWDMLLLAQKKKQWFSNKVFSSINFAKEKFGGREYYNIEGVILPKANDKELKRARNNHQVSFMLGKGDILSTEWLANYKNSKHPNDDWTQVDLVTYSKYIYMFNHEELDNLISEAAKAGVLGYLD